MPSVGSIRHAVWPAILIAALVAMQVRHDMMREDYEALIANAVQSKMDQLRSQSRELSRIYMECYTPSKGKK